VWRIVTMRSNIDKCRMKNKFLIGVAIIGAIITINSCDSEENALPAPITPANCDTSGMTYSSGAGAPIQTIINAQCATSPSCHGAGAPKAQGDFTNWGSGQFQSAIYGGQGSTMYQYLQPTYSTPMPSVPQPGWSECDRLKILAWLNAGDPQ
jgi:hypothetical protein